MVDSEDRSIVGGTELLAPGAGCAHAEAASAVQPPHDQGLERCASAPDTLLAAATAPYADTINPLRLAVLQRPGRGRGVFAPCDIPAGTLLEEAPVLLLTKEQWDNGLNDTILGEYGFCWSNGGMAIGLGIASLFNHSPTPNVNYIRNTSAGTITFRTTRSVSAGDELCICYTADESKLWFLPTGERPRPLTPSDDGDGAERLAALTLNLSDDEEAEEMRRAAARKDAARDAARETRRQQGGSTHSARENRREKYRQKKERQDAKQQEHRSTSPKKPEVVAPQPVRSVPGARAASSLIPSSTSAQSTPNDTPPSGTPSRHKHVGPVVMTPDLSWDDKDPSPLPEAQWGILRRARGPIEIEEEADDDNSAMITVWIADVDDARRVMKELLAFTKSGLALDSRMRHLKRVRRIADASGEHTYVALAMVDTVDEAQLREALGATHPLLAELELQTIQVPRAAARTQEQLRIRNAVWPVAYAPGIVRSPDARDMTVNKLSWVAAGIQRVLSDARAAKASGELPIAAFCASLPEQLWPGPDSGFIPATPGLRAAAHDTRVSEVHPLRHAVFNCIACIARLRTVPPFSNVTATRNGADYLLTSMSLFVTHEPCVMCTMALVHSRVREVFFVFPARSGGFESSFGVHSRRDLNHRFDAWRWCGDLAGADPAEFALPDGAEV